MTRFALVLWAELRGSEGVVQGTLLLAILRIKSSYSRNIELRLEETDGVPDTVQWWFDNNGCYRIRTYALDHDIHVWDIGHSPKATLELARTNNSKHYADVIAAQYEIHLTIPAMLRRAERHLKR